MKKQKDEAESLQQWKLPLSGKQIALRIVIAASAVILALVLYFALSDAYERPIQKYYKGFQQNDADVMSEAFPEWLRNAKGAETDMSVKAMCLSMISVKNLNYGKDVSVNAGVIEKKAVDADKLRTLEKGIEARYGVSVKVSAGWDCTLAVTYRDKSGKETKSMEYATVYKIDGSWYMIDVAAFDKK